MSDHDQVHVGKLPLLGIAALIGITVVGVGATSLTRDRSAPVVIEGVLLEERVLHFADTPTGGVEVIDALTGEQLDVLDAGSGGFLRSTLRGLARERRSYSAGADVPFHIQRYDTGRLMLVDPVTNRQIDLVAFGPINAGNFTRYLTASTRSAGTVQETKQ